MLFLLFLTIICDIVWHHPYQWNLFQCCIAYLLFSSKIKITCHEYIKTRRIIGIILLLKIPRHTNIPRHIPRHNCSPSIDTDDGAVFACNCSSSCIGLLLLIVLFLWALCNLAYCGLTKCLCNSFIFGQPSNKHVFIVIRCVSRITCSPPTVGRDFIALALPKPGDGLAGEWQVPLHQTSPLPA